jgi:beta-galactosidase
MTVTRQFRRVQEASVPSSSFFRAVLYFLLFLFTAIPTQIPGQNAILMGVAWYPEQWPESRWEEDLRLMEAAN